MARLIPLHLIPALIATASHAGEVTIEPRPFSIEKSFTATALPNGESVLLKVEPKAWTDFKITAITPHGTKVTKGDVLLRFDAEAIDKKLEDARRALDSGKLALEQAEFESKILQENAPNKLEAARRAAEIAKEENAYFTQIRRQASKETAEQAVKRCEQILANQREELKQLEKMYAADDLTEDTEQIILIRQKDAVAAAEFALSMERLDHKRTLEFTLPREAKTLAYNESDAAISLKKAETDIPRSIELNKLALETLKTTNLRAKQDFAELEADRTHFEFKAPADGVFYYGPIDNGRWTPGELIKHLVVNGRPPINTAIATFIPGAANLALVAFLDDATARSIKPGQAGIATLAGREDVEIPVKLAKLATAPGPDGSYRADLSLTWPSDITPAAGAVVQIRLISYQQAAAITIPTKALTYGSAGWTVEVKLADGKTERRAVKRGRVAKEETEILAGIEIGQVIIVP